MEITSKQNTYIKSINKDKPYFAANISNITLFQEEE